MLRLKLTIIFYEKAQTMLYLVTKKCAQNLLEVSKTKAINNVPLGLFLRYLTFTKCPFSKAFIYCCYTIHHREGRFTANCPIHPKTIHQ